MANEILNKIKIALGMDVPTEKHTFAEVATLEDGTTVTADSFEVGQVLYVVDADGNANPATPDMQYVINGKTITVDADGVILEAIEAAAEIEVEVPEAETPATPSEEVNPEIATLTENVAQLMDVITVLIEKVKKLEDANASATQAMSSLEEKFSNIPGATRITSGVSTSKLTAEELLTKRFVDAAASLNNKQ